MLDRTDNITTTASNWLGEFEHALADHDEILLNALFQGNSHWRDVLALTWRITTINGGSAIASELCKHNHARPSGFKLAPGRTAPRQVAFGRVSTRSRPFSYLKRGKAGGAAY